MASLELILVPSIFKVNDTESKVSHATERAVKSLFITLNVDLPVRLLVALS